MNGALEQEANRGYAAAVWTEVKASPLSSSRSA